MSELCVFGVKDEVLSSTSFYYYISCAVFVVGSLIASSVILSLWWRKRFWSSLSVRSSTCTIAFFLCSLVNLLIEPIILLIVPFAPEGYTNRGTVVGDSLRGLFLASRINLSIIYIVKAARVIVCFTPRDSLTSSYLQAFLKSEKLVLVISLAIGSAVAVCVQATSLSEGLYLPIEKDYLTPKNFIWSYVQSFETVTLSTLIYLMWDIVPYYKFSSELLALFVSNLFLTFVSQFTSIEFHKECGFISTSIAFIVSEARNIFQMCFCVVLPIRNSYMKNLVLPDDTEFEKTLVDSTEGQASLLFLFGLYEDQLTEPFVDYLTYLDEMLCEEAPEATRKPLIKILKQVAARHPLIQGMRNFQEMFQFYVEAQLAVQSKNTQTMRDVIHQFLRDVEEVSPEPAQSTTIIRGSSDILPVNQGIQQTVRSLTAGDSLSTLRATGLLSGYDDSSYFHLKTQKKTIVQRIRECIKRSQDENKPQSPSNLFTFSRSTKRLVYEAFAVPQDNGRQAAIALSAVSYELLTCIHLVWSSLFSRTKAFYSIQNIFEQYGKARPRLLEFKLGNYDENKTSPRHQQPLTVSYQTE